MGTKKKMKTKNKQVRQNPSPTPVQEQVVPQETANHEDIPLSSLDEIQEESLQDLKENITEVKQQKVPQAPSIELSTSVVESPQKVPQCPTANEGVTTTGQREPAKKESLVEDKDTRAVPQSHQSVPGLLFLDKVKHPLQFAWSFWYYQGIKNQPWKFNLKHVYDFSTIEDFWSVYNHVIPPSELTVGRDYNLFKKDVRPEWEDPRNRKGGKWSVTPASKTRKVGNEIDDLWKEILMAMVGGGFGDQSPLICGASYSARKQQDRISVWIESELSLKEEIFAIGKIIKHAMSQIGSHCPLEYSTNEDWASKKGSTVDVRYTL